MTNLLALLVLPFFAGLTLAQAPLPVGHKALSVLWANRANASHSGDVTFTQLTPDSNVTIMGTITGLDRNVSRGMHIHEFGDLSQGCDSTGIHFNPTNMTHGDRTDPVRHVGDLGNIMSDANGNATFNFTIDMVSIFTNSTNSVIGRALVIHEGEDDLGKGNQLDSNTTGHAGGRFACGIIGISA